MFSPKNLLRHPLAKSPLAEFSETASDKDPNIQVNLTGGLKSTAEFVMD